MKPKRSLTQQDQVIGAITTHGKPMNLFAIFQACDCFADKEECAKLLKHMVNRAEINTRKLPNDAHPLYATPEMVWPAETPVPPLRPRMGGTDLPSAKPSASEMETAMRVVPAFMAKVESTPGVDMDAHTPRASVLHVNPKLALNEPTPSDLDDYEADADEVLEFLRANVTPDEFRGYLKCQLVTLTLRGTPQDLQAQQHYARALARFA